MSTNKSERKALVVGITQYDDLNFEKKKFDELNRQVAELEELAILLEEHGNFDVIRLPSKLTERGLDLQGTVELPDLEFKIEQLLFPTNEPPPKTALLFFVGHGLLKKSDLSANKVSGTDEVFDEVFLATRYVTEEQPCVHGLSLKTLHEILCSSSVKQQIVFLEAGYSDKFIDITQKAKEKASFCLSFCQKKPHYHFATTTIRRDKIASWYEIAFEVSLTTVILDYIRAHINNHSNSGKKTHLTSEMLYKHIEERTGSQQIMQDIHNGQAIVLF
jgi:hypothetical protein